MESKHAYLVILGLVRGGLDPDPETRHPATVGPATASEIEMPDPVPSRVHAATHRVIEWLHRTLVDGRLQR